ncbi:MAG: ThiF family adenylyltransferase [Actinobacteria bacterium]|nr:ThiF family adenylyltransferase [Actinomycetota bacterium]
MSAPVTGTAPTAASCARLDRRPAPPEPAPLAPSAPLVAPAEALTAAETDRYSRHLTLPGFGDDAQRRLKNARVLVIGAGGLGSSALLYLAAAGVGTIGIVDDDRVEPSNLQRQVVHTTAGTGTLKVDSARETLLALNPLIRVERHPLRLSAGNALELFLRYDLVIDGADNFATRYLVSDAAAIAGIPCVWGAILRYSAQVSVFWEPRGPGYRDLFPDSPPAASAPSCGEAGVLGMLCGAAGSVMAAEAVKILTGVGRPLIGRLATFDLAESTWRELRIVRDPARPVVTQLQDDVPAACTVVGDVRPIDSAALRLLLAERAAGRADFVLLDVREPEESAQGDIPGSRSAPLATLDAMTLADLSPERRVVLYCTRGVRARAAAHILRDAGYRDLDVLTGGMLAWTAQR